jgi:multicomponent Na+:H+ antiporter subunit B
MKERTGLMDVISRKLAPFVMLFGLYLIAYAHRSPGGGFQGGVVIASAVILLALGRDIYDVERLFPLNALHLAEAVAFLFILALALAGLSLGQDVFAYPSAAGTAGAAGAAGSSVAGPIQFLLTPRRFLFAINLMIGLKVGSGVTLLVLTLFEDDRRRP